MSKWFGVLVFFSTRSDWRIFETVITCVVIGQDYNYNGRISLIERWINGFQLKFPFNLSLFSSVAEYTFVIRMKCRKEDEIVSFVTWYFDIQTFKWHVSLKTQRNFVKTEQNEWQKRHWFPWLEIKLVLKIAKRIFESKRRNKIKK